MKYVVMSTFEATVLGIVQGLTEFLPISSTAHLRIVPAFANWPDPGAAFTAVTQLGTLTAVLVYFRKDLWNIARALLAGIGDPEKRSRVEFKLGIYIILGTIPIAILGLAFKDQIETTARSLYVIGTTLVVFGVILGIADVLGKHRRGIESLTPKDGALLGLAQALALIPGVSRSGATISAGLFLGLERAAAARYSFLLSIPAVVLSGLFELRKIGGEGSVGFIPTAIATVLAFAFGWLSIAGLIRFLQRRSTLVFVIYRVGLGVLVLALAASGAID